MLSTDKRLRFFVEILGSKENVFSAAAFECGNERMYPTNFFNCGYLTFLFAYSHIIKKTHVKFGSRIKVPMNKGPFRCQSSLVEAFELLSKITYKSSTKLLSLSLSIKVRVASKTDKFMKNSSQI